MTNATLVARQQLIKIQFSKATQQAGNSEETGGVIKAGPNEKITSAWYNIVRGEVSLPGKHNEFDPEYGLDIQRYFINLEASVVGNEAGNKAILNWRTGVGDENRTFIAHVQLFAAIELVN